MVVLTLFKKDGSIYFRENFESPKYADAWLEHFKTEPGWSDELRVEVQDLTENIRQEREQARQRIIEQAAQAAQKHAVIGQIKQEIKELKDKRLTASELELAVKKLIQLIEVMT